MAIQADDPLAAARFHDAVFENNLQKKTFR